MPQSLAVHAHSSPEVRQEVRRPARVRKTTRTSRTEGPVSVALQREAQGLHVIPVLQIVFQFAHL